METDLPQECEVCEKPLSPMQAEGSYDATFKIGEGGSVLCGKHLDRSERTMEGWD